MITTFRWRIALSPLLFCGLALPGTSAAQETDPQPIEVGPSVPTSADAFAELPVIQLPVPESPALQPEVIATLDPEGPGKECSGIVGSRQWRETYWMINDSGDEPRIYAINGRGENFVKSRSDETAGVRLGGAINVDWEEIAVDASGHVIVCDVGNNRNDRRDLTLYYIPEPSPVASRAIPSHRRRIHYPDQTRFPAAEQDFNFDCEGVFTVGDDVFLISKHRVGREARVYRLPAESATAPLDEDRPRSEPFAAQPRRETLEPFARLIPNGQVTGADASADGRRLVLTTYDQVWLFERDSVDTSWFDGRLAHGRFVSPQVESVCFDETGEGLLLADEKEGRLMRVRIDQLTVVRDDRTSNVGGGNAGSSETADATRDAAETSPMAKATAAGIDLWGDDDVSVGAAATLPTVEQMESITPGAWTMVVFPDTQYYVDLTRKIPATPEVFKSMSRWVAEQHEPRNIRLVLHVGDIVDNDDPAEYRSALRALQPLHGVVPTIVCTGNHEYEGNSKVRRTRFNEFFRPETDPLIDPARGGILRETFVEGSLINAAYEFLAPDARPMLILSLEWGARDEVLDWADHIAGLPKYQDHTAVLLNHAFLYHDDTRYDFASKGRSQSANPLRYGTAATGDNNDGQMIWDKLVRKHTNFEMVFCGHVSGHLSERMAYGSDSEVGYLVSPGRGGNRVHQLLFNAQRRGDAGDGWLRLLEFQPDGRTVVVKTYSPHRDAKGLYCWRTDEDDHFSFQLDPR